MRPGTRSQLTTQELRLQVNGEHRSVEVETDETLLSVLRDKLKLYGNRQGCGIGYCGACTVLVDGKPVSSCIMLAVQVEGKQLTTVEGLSKDGKLHPVQQAFLDHTAFQCSYCTPGFILTTKAMLDEEPSPSREEIREYLVGNLCRCGSYYNIIEAAEEAAARMQARKQFTSD
jgi:aerobic-type carbon monoxide dehydrogenase small subunit (CoxS/CutS family)